MSIIGNRLGRLAVSALALVGLGLAAAPAGAAGKTLTIGIEQEPNGFDAVKGRVLGEAPASVMLTMVDRLMEPPFDNPKPALATAIKVSDDGKTVTYTLRKGVMFHDGTPFNADAVVEHFTRILNPKNRYIGLLFISPMQSVEKVDDYTVRVNHKHTWLPARAGLSSFSLCCFIPSPKAVAEDTMNRHPIGTGPYKFKEWKGGDRIVVERNPEYWDRDAKVYFDEIVFRLIPDMQTRTAALQSGEIDAEWTDRGHSIQTAKKDANLVVYERPGQGGGILFLNNSKPPLDDVRVRRAISKAWHQEHYTKNVLLGVQPKTEHGMGPNAKCDAGYHADGDFEGAKKLVAEVGKPIEVELMHTATQRGRDYGLLFQQLVKRGGMKMELRPIDQLSFVRTVFTNDYQMAGWRIADAGDIGPQLFALLHSKSPYNLAHYKSEEMDKLAVAMRVAATPEAREKAMCAVVRKMNEDAPILWGNGRNHHAIAKKSLKGIGELYQGVLDVRFAYFEN